MVTVFSKVSEIPSVCAINVLNILKGSQLANRKKTFYDGPKTNSYMFTTWRTAKGDFMVAWVGCFQTADSKLYSLCPLMPELMLITTMKSKNSARTQAQNMSLNVCWCSRATPKFMQIFRLKSTLQMQANTSKENIFLPRFDVLFAFVDKHFIHQEIL